MGVGDAVVGVSALAASAFQVAGRDAADYGGAHAFRRADGDLAKLGDSGAVELVPRSTSRPEFGWPLTLPAAGAFAQHGGGLILDPLELRPVELRAAPRCNPERWSRFVGEARARLPRRTHAGRQRRLAPERNALRGYVRPPFDPIDIRTRDFLAGHAAEGTRNGACFTAACNLLGAGVAQSEVERLILRGAVACGLGEREARTCIASAVGALRRKGRI
jgi:hypothetical protein